MREVISNNNLNWQDSFTAGIQGPGTSWEYSDAHFSEYSDQTKLVVIDEIISQWKGPLTFAVWQITIKGIYKSWGYILVDVARLSWAYTLLALKLTQPKLDPAIVKSNVAVHVLDYLSRSISNDPSDNQTLTNILAAKKLELATLLLEMESWCDRWVRVSDFGFLMTGGKDGRMTFNRVRVGRMTGGAKNPVLGATEVVGEEDSRYNAATYPGYPGGIDWRDEEPARVHCNSQKAASVQHRDKLSADIVLLQQKISNVLTDIKNIEEFMATA